MTTDKGNTIYVYENIPATMHNQTDLVILYKIDSKGHVKIISEKEYLVNSVFTNKPKEDRDEYIDLLRELGAMEINEYVIKNKL